MKHIDTNEQQYHRLGVDTAFPNSFTAKGVDLTDIRSYPLYWIWHGMKNAETHASEIAHLSFAYDYYGESCVDAFFQRCERHENK